MPPVRPTSCSATNSTARAGVSISSSRCSKAVPSRAHTLTHLDRCLTCRNCETTCPSGVQYHKLLDIGRDMAEQKIERTWLAPVDALDVARHYSLSSAFHAVAAARDNCSGRCCRCLPEAFRAPAPDSGPVANDGARAPDAGARRLCPARHLARTSMPPPRACSTGSASV